MFLTIKSSNSVSTDAHPSPNDSMSHRRLRTVSQIPLFLPSSLLKRIHSNRSGKHRKKKVSQYQFAQSPQHKHKKNAQPLSAFCFPPV